jgi:hypothetical protein
MITPRYLKQKSFFKMNDSGDLLNITAIEGLDVDVHYAELYGPYREENIEPDRK